MCHLESARYGEYIYQISQHSLKKKTQEFYTQLCKRIFQSWLYNKIGSNLYTSLLTHIEAKGTRALSIEKTRVFVHVAKLKQLFFNLFYYVLIHVFIYNTCTNM